MSEKLEFWKQDLQTRSRQFKGRNYKIKEFWPALALSAFTDIDCSISQAIRIPHGEGEGTPLQYSCLENPMDGGGLVGCSPWGLKESDTTERLHFHFSLSCIGEVNGNPLQCSCLENPRDGGAWWAAIYGVAQSRTRLKWLSSSSSKNTPKHGPKAKVQAYCIKARSIQFHKCLLSKTLLSLYHMTFFYLLMTNIFPDIILLFAHTATLCSICPPSHFIGICFITTCSQPAGLPWWLRR